MRVLKVLTFTLALLSSISMVYGQEVIESRTLPPFGAINIEGPIRVELIKSDTARLNATLWDMSKRDLDWRVKNGVLSISARRGMINRMAYVDMKLYYTDLNTIANSGAEIRSQETILSSLLRINALSSAGDIELNVRCAELIVNTSGQNRVMLSGTSDFSILRAKLGSAIECYSLESNSVEATATEGASIELRANSNLVVRASTMGHVRYITNQNAVIDSRRKSLGKLTAISTQ